MKLIPCPWCFGSLKEVKRKNRQITIECQKHCGFIVKISNRELEDFYEEEKMLTL
jgi:hypothetical protein